MIRFSQRNMYGLIRGRYGMSLLITIFFMAHVFVILLPIAGSLCVFHNFNKAG